MSTSRLIKVHGRLYQLVDLVAAQHNEYETLKKTILEDENGTLSQMISTLKALAGKLVLFGEHLSNDDARFITVMSSRLNEDARTSSMAYDLGDSLAQLERMADKMLKAMPAELRGPVQK